MRFQGKIAPWWYAIIVFFNAITIALYVRNGVKGSTTMYIPLLVIVDLFMIPVIFKNYVEVEKDNVTVYFGLIKKAIPTKKITKIKQMRNFQASFSASFDRIGIECETMNNVYISIADKQGFLKELLKVNRNIKYIIS